MHLFISAGEPSGDLHGANLARELRRLHPNARLAGFGGDKMADAGCDLLYPLCRLAVMWFIGPLLHIATFFRLLWRADRYFRDHKPDAVVLIDYPGFHWWLAWRAHARGIPVFYFVPPQLWAWAGWRVKKMKKYVQHILATLPFEPAWYAARGVVTEYVGHPYFDELPGQELDRDFVARQQARPTPLVTLLPGSRDQEVRRNFPILLRAAQRVFADRPNTRFAVACYNDKQRAVVEQHLAGVDLPVEIHVGRTPELIECASACAAVSGSVGLELMWRGKPTTVVYRLNSTLDLKVGNFFRTCRFISLVNLLAEEEVFPEYLTVGDPSAEMAGHLLRWLNEPAERAAVVAKLQALREKVAEPGACERAARTIAEQVASRSQATGSGAARAA